MNLDERWEIDRQTEYFRRVSERLTQRFVLELGRIFVTGRPHRDPRRWFQCPCGAWRGKNSRYRCSACLRLPGDQ